MANQIFCGPHGDVPSFGMNTRIHRAGMIRSPDRPEHAVQIDDFIVAEREGFTAFELKGLKRHLAALVNKLDSVQSQQHHDLQVGTNRLIEILLSDEVTEASDPLPPHLAEAGVAIRYILKGADLIPDWIPEIGLTDDARIVARVFERNPALRGGA